MDERDLVRMIDETCMNVGMDLYPEGWVWPLRVLGVKACASHVQNVQSNVVGMTTLTEANVDEVIQRVIERYQQEHKSFCWLVGPTSRPADLGDYLHAAGFRQEMAAVGMVLRNLSHAITVNPAVRVEQVSLADLDAKRSMLAEAYGHGMSEEAITLGLRFAEAYGERATCYLAYLQDHDEPVASSLALLDVERQCVLLRGGAVLEAYRGKGIYTAMVAKRLDDARAMGAASAIIQADKQTSAPICAKLGFEAVCSFHGYIYRLSA
jgi:GNAT superfamily N-acetyltransferase